MPPTSPSISCGVAGWAFPQWSGLVYPQPSRRSFHPLEFIAARFDTVEIPLSFYQPVRPELARLWLAKVSHNPRFRFTARLGREFTHERLLNPARAGLFSAGLEPLVDQERLGALLMQFPNSFRFTEENKDFLIRLRRAFHRFPLVAEFRHDTWGSEEGLGTLIDYKIGFCNLDQPEGVRAMPPTSHLTSPVGYVKLHGRRCGPGFSMFDDRALRSTGNDYFFSLVELEAWNVRIRHLARFAESVYVIFNNDGGGKAVLNALQLQGMLTGVEHRPPKMLALAHRGELGRNGKAATAQKDLFSPAA
jgi:uncharacterized protein YecE (DUF72 family)